MGSSLISHPRLNLCPDASTAPPCCAHFAVRGAYGVVAVMRCQAQASDMNRLYMRRCVEQARKAAGHTSPNPMVGCVIVRDGRVFGEGFHPKAGQPQAEVFALRDARDLAKNATAYVSLEPCNHYGRTPPCTEAFINAKVKDVVVGMTDPNPIVAFKGIERLKSARIDVRLCTEEEASCRKLNEAYIHRMLTGKAFETFSNFAKTNTLPISHEAGAKQPLYIIMAQGEDSQLNIPFIKEGSAPEAVVLTDSPISVEPAGIEVLVLDRMNLESILQLLAQRGLCNVLVDFREAGGDISSLLNNFQEAKLQQKVLVELLPIWTVSQGPCDLAFGDSQSFPLKDMEHKEVNGCVLLEGYV
ncbi:hypothetical protein E2562_035282 [Oryza meyeriana var. granulata]|uniref:Riboflavin biosynthesis protein PYRD, chloroplastic n=1 Tax=Oryza meyeriana var. granulata TaxID=110450 RepID=A0A6G1F1N9_9ORYZ|nr:hypothetical protein E2562_035282 [Oryza meyeriana var. granulata]